MAPASLTIFLSAPAATKAAGAAFADCIRASASLPAIVTLEGPLGAGKTTFAQGFGEAMGAAPGDVASPTFSLADVHRLGGAVLNHLDLYRLGGDGPPEDALREFLEAGLDECLDEGFSLVEWPERLPEGWWPQGRYRVRIVMAEGGVPPDGGGSGASAPPGRVLELSGEFDEGWLRALLGSRGLEASPP